MGPDDAQFVDAYHTNGGDAWMQFGSKENRGNVDVRFNGGGLQPGCKRKGQTISVTLFYTCRLTGQI
ncbi:hypothetical protein WDU94_010176 [Cyamophila willieti]